VAELWACIVEGDGEAGKHGKGGALPLLLRRIVHDKLKRYTINLKPYNAHGRDNLLKPGGVERFLELALGESKLRAIIVVLDAEADCAAQIGKDLADRARRLSPRVPVAIVVTNKCYEPGSLAGFVCQRPRKELLREGRRECSMKKFVKGG
jgi:hypothetical protein